MKYLQPIHRFDVFLFHWCMARRCRRLLTHVSRTVSKTADGHLYLFVSLIFALIDWRVYHPFLMTFALAFTVERLMYLVLKNSCRRSRPQESLIGFQSFIIPSDKFSFPSGHTSAAFLFTVLFSSQLPELSPVLLIWALLVALSRVFLGVHFPSDTVVGALLGSTVAFYSLSFGGVF